jgi:predicted O-methyltransferase YrrM
MKRLIGKFVPQSLQNWVLRRKDEDGLRQASTAEFTVENLISGADVRLAEILDNRETLSAWEKAEPQFRKFGVPDGTGGVNPGDRRALYYLVSHFRPGRMLEVGTHIGASTMHAASAISTFGRSDGGEERLITVDIGDVNDPVSKPWLQYGTRYSPAELVKELGLSKLVRFVRSPSLDFMERCEQRFDFIFLDGDHAARTVYLEVAAALRLLNPRGVILLHDYFPDLRPLWSNNKLLAGPFLGVRRIREEGVPVRVIPLGGLPWPTKLGSNVTSLALLVKDAA